MDQAEHKSLAPSDGQTERLEAFAQSLTRMRKKAIDARLASGIETIWSEDEEHYEGVDDQNRGQEKSAWLSKPPGQMTPGSKETRSIVFPNITRPYVDAAAAKIGDTLLPTDDRAWSFNATPSPDLVSKAMGKIPDAQKGMAEIGVPQETQQQVVQIESQQALAAIKEAKERAQKAEKQVEDWHVECHYHAEMRRAIDDFCRIGTGILKGPFPKISRKQAWTQNALVLKEEILPASKRVDPWNFYPAAGCGEDIQKGNCTWERDEITKRALGMLKEEPGYIAKQIDICLEEGPKKAAVARKKTDGQSVDDTDLYEIWFGYCHAEKEDIEAAGCECKKEGTLFVMVTMVNDHVVKVNLVPMQEDGFPYDLMPYQRRVGMPWGTGVSRQIRVPQQITTAAVRSMLTNAGRAAGPMMVFKNNLTPADGTNDVTPWKVYYASDDDTTDDARKLVALIQFPDLQASMMAIVQFGMKLAEDVTGLPLLLQGQAGSAPETLGGQQLVDRNASAVMRRIARTIDDTLTEPHIRRYYSWLLKHGPDDAKGDFSIDARGSTALVDKETYRGELQQYLQASLNPAFELSPSKIMSEIMRMNRRSPDDFKMSDKEKKALQQAQAKPQQQDTSIQVAQIRADTELKAEQFKAAEAEKQRAFDREMKIMDRDIEVLKTSQTTGVSVAKIKAELAKTVMTLRAQKELSGTNAAEPVVEPKGVAPPGEAFQK